MNTLRPLGRLYQPSSFSLLSASSSSFSLLPRRLFSTTSVSHPSHKLQIYNSSSTDPFINLSIEHFLLQTSPADATVLLFYVNRPSIVIGRNQNPWTEVNLNALAGVKAPGVVETKWHASEPIDVVRRRSGGGTVFHDSGNVNFSVICPSKAFDRNKHAEMVVRALKGLGKLNTRVNERHDIVLDHKDGSTTKISGSAYKLIRQRSLHHGTCLLNSPNLKNISGLLRSPGNFSGHITSYGSPSVRSPVANVGLDNDSFIDAVTDEFEMMYGEADVQEVIGDESITVGNIADGLAELKSRDWIYGQTPRWTLESQEADGVPHTKIQARHGKIDLFEVTADSSIDTSSLDTSILLQKQVWDIAEWTPLLQSAGLAGSGVEPLGNWLNLMLGTAFASRGSA